MILNQISELLKESELDIPFYFYKLCQIGSYDSFNREEIIVKDPLTEKHKEAFTEIINSTLDKSMSIRLTLLLEKGISIEYQVTFTKGDMYEPLWNVSKLGVYQSDNETEKFCADSNSEMSDDHKTEKNYSSRAKMTEENTIFHRKGEVTIIYFFSVFHKSSHKHFEHISY